VIPRPVPPPGLIDRSATRYQDMSPHERPFSDEP
jgi:hypothetical protein